jgi:predicted ATP-dependent protease
VTGSVNQKDEVQPIGGINQKIEGFFDVYRDKGLSGIQGVMMPAKNLKHLMLRNEVIEAVKEGKFHIWAVNTIDEGIQVLTGVEARKMEKDGSHPEGTVNYKVAASLKAMAERLRSFSGMGRDGEGKKKEK